MITDTGFPEFEIPGIERTDNFLEAIDKIMNDDEYCQRAFNDSVEYINEFLLLSKVNKLRAEILKEICLT